jgi:hypothetical protein
MNTPGFTAEASLDRMSENYVFSSNHASETGRVMPQLFVRWWECGEGGCPVFNCSEFGCFYAGMVHGPSSILQIPSVGKQILGVGRT